jgi:peroxiredoxin
MTSKGTTISARCQQEFLAALDAWRERQLMPPSRAAALRHLAAIGLRHEAGNKTQHVELARRAAFVIDQDRRKAAKSRAARSARKRRDA